MRLEHLKLSYPQWTSRSKAVAQHFPSACLLRNTCEKCLKFIRLSTAVRLSFAKRLAIFEGGAQFTYRYNGREVGPLDTPESLGMVEGEIAVIKVSMR
eukprot:COSAG05_NODE_8262_length_721_cov_0.895498_1_plen_98_part_00